MSADSSNERKSPLKEITQPFIDLLHAPRALWGINLSYVIEGMVYFGMVNYLAMYFNEYIGLNDMWAGWMVMELTAGITIAMFFLGTVADRRGVRFALLLAFTLMFIGRGIVSLAPLTEPQHANVVEDKAGRNDPMFIFTDAEPVPIAGEEPAEPGADVEPTTQAAVGSEEVGAAGAQPVPTEEASQRAAGDAVSEAAESPSPGLGSMAHVLAALGILIIVVGYGMYQPGAYAAVRQFTTPKTAAMGFAMLYALMNLGGYLPTFAAMVRNNGVDTFGVKLTGAGMGILGTYWVYTGCTVLALLATYFILSKRTVAKAIASAKAEREREKGTKAQSERPADATDETAQKAAVEEKTSNGFWLWSYLKNHPLTDLKFAFFIFCLIPVQTLFAHNWLTLPMYVERAYRESWPWISKNFEFAVNFNPLLIFVLVPIVTALTHRAKVYNMMIIGTFVMAAPSFLLIIGPYWWTLLAYIVLMTIGEAMWQPRFLQYAAEIAPEGRTGEYMGVAQLPWFLTKMLVPLYSGWFLLNHCPQVGEQNTEFMWLIYACIAMSSTVLLILAKGWIGKDFKTKAD